MKDRELIPAVAADNLARTEAAESFSLPSDKRRWLMVGAIVVLVLLFAMPLVSLFVHAAASEINSYILLVPFVAGYLFWTEKEMLPGHYSASPAAAISLVLLGCAALAGALIANAGGVISNNDWLSLMVLSFVFFLAAAGFLILGRLWMTAAAFPFAFLIFIVPMPEGMVNALEIASQHASAAAAGLFFWLGNTPYLRDGVVFQLPNITLEVAQECSGIRSSWVLLITSILTANLFLRTTWKRLLLVALVIPLGILRNGFRVWAIGMLCDLFGPQMIHSPIHRHGGPLFFAISLIPFFLLLYCLRRGEGEGAEKSVASTAS